MAVVDIKEKWGSLRVWVVTEGLILKQESDAVLAKYLAEERSRFTCEVCGKPGLIRKPPTPRFAWLRCLCDEHSTAEMVETWTPDRRQIRRPHRGVAYVYDSVSDRMRVDEEWRPR